MRYFHHAKSSFLALLVALNLSGCAWQEQRYQENLALARVPSWVRLSRSDREGIIRLVSRATQQPIIGISKLGEEVSVYTGEPDGSSPRDFREYSVAKTKEGWRIVSWGDISPTVITIVLSSPPGS